MKRLISIVLACCMALSLVGCWWDDEPAPRPSASPMPPASGVQPGSTAPGSAGSHMPAEEPPTIDGRPDLPGSTAGSDPSGASYPEPESTPGQSRPARAAAANAAALPEGPWALALVNASHPLPEDFALQTKAIPGYDSRMFDARAAGALEQLLDAAAEEGCPLYLVSAYRSIARQKALFLRKTNYYKAEGLNQQQAEAEAAKLVARPGTSEHNLGLAADMVSADWYSTHDDLTAEFDATPAFAWLQKNAARFGFVLRYPKGREARTGVDYEPWHWRYVGPTAARRMNAAGQCLEEYLASA